MILHYIEKLLCGLGFHKQRYWQEVKKVHENKFVYKILIADGCKCDRCGKKLWRRDFSRKRIII